MNYLNLLKQSSVCVIFCLFSITLNAQFKAEFSANPTSGCSPLVVNFTDQSTGNPTYWKWDLGNGTVSFLRNPSTTYFTPGQYTIKLVVKNANNADSITKTQYITIFARPDVEFSATNRSGCYPLAVQFTDQSTTNNGTISQWQWDFGDGNFGTTQNPLHTYTTTGNFNVSLIVTNSNGCFKNITKSQYIIVADGVEADFMNTAANTCTPPVNINFQNLSTGTGTLTYNWDFGDGNSSTLEHPSHNYSTPGSFNVRLIVTNSSGCKDTIIKNNAVSIGAINTAFNIPDSSCVGVPIPMNNTSTPIPASAFWSFGDGSTSTAISTTKTYSLPGTYQLKLINNYGACIDSLSKTIVISPIPTVNFSTADTISCSNPFTVQFTNSSSGAVSYQWLFGDGTSSTQINPSHTYLNPGNYTVRLLAYGANGCGNNLIKQQYIKVQLPQVVINLLPQEGCAPFAWTFDATVNSSAPIATYLWNFGDGSTSTLQNPTHIFNTGTFNISLTVTTTNGCSNTATIPQGIRVGNKPTAAFSATPRNVCANVPAQFTDLSTGNTDRWFWDFGDGSTSTLQNPSHVYNDTGVFNIQLIVWNNGCSDTLSVTNYIHILPPIASYVVATSCQEKLKRIFTDHSIGADQWTWDFGDGTSSTQQSPTHYYATAGVYTVSLTVKNNLTGCTYTHSTTERILSENAGLSVSDTVICKKTPITFTATGVNPANLGLIQWYFGDSTISTGQTVAHTYNQSGIYDIMLITIDWNGCRDTIRRPQYIRVTGPTAVFSTGDTTSCLQNTVLFNDQSQGDGISPITQWSWNFGDGNIINLPNGPFQHTYANPGIFSVTLIVTDGNGCKDTSIKAGYLTVSKPVASFSAQTLICPGRPVIFTDSSSGNNLNYHWDFGDGTTSTDAIPNHSYVTDGTYTIKLVVTDRYGCSDSMIRANYITVSTPISQFTMSDSIGTCPPLIINFTNNSQNFTSIRWDFGDGTFTTNPNPSHFYNVPGTYYATLTATGYGGCTVVSQQRIIVRGPYGSFTYGDLSGCKPFTVNFRATTTDRISFVWDFNDGTTLATSDSIVSHTYSLPGQYVPRMILIDIAGCTVPILGQDTIVVHGIQADFNFNQPIICDSGNVQFNNLSSTTDQIISHTWSFGDGSQSTAINPVHYYNQTGIYYPNLIVTTQSGCIDSLKSLTPVKVVSSPKGLITQSANGCVPLQMTFNGSLAIPDTSTVTWLWNFGNGQTSATQNPAIQPYVIAGIYPVSLIVTNSSGCNDTTNTSIDAFALPNVQAGNDTLICQGRGKQLQASGAVSYTWTPSIGLSCTTCANPIALPDSVTTYLVTGTSAQGCKKSDAIKVSVKYPFIMTNSSRDTICAGSNSNLFANGGHSYIWTPSTGLSSATASNPVASPTISTTYQVISWDDVHCFSDTALIPIIVYQYPTVEAGPDKSINVGQSIDLVPVISSDVTNVTWSPTGSIFRSTYPSISVKPKETTTYIVEVVNQGGCLARDNMTVYVLCDGSNVFIPNTFSPNNDGANDIFYPRGTGLFKIRSAKVFNRWGQIVFDKSNFNPNDQQSGWNGNFKGQALTSDTYVYVFEIICDNNQILTYKGNVSLIR